MKGRHLSRPTASTRLVLRSVRNLFLVFDKKRVRPMGQTLFSSHNFRGAEKYSLVAARTFGHRHSIAIRLGIVSRPSAMS